MEHLSIILVENTIDNKASLLDKHVFQFILRALEYSWIQLF